MEIPCEDSKDIWEIVSSTRTAHMKENGENEDRVQPFRKIISAS